MDDDTSTEATPAKRRNPVGLLLVVAVVVAAGVALAAGLANEHHDGSTAGASTPTTVDVWYIVGGNVSGASITMRTPTGISQQDVDVPLTTKSGDEGLHFTFASGAPVYLSAQNDDAQGSLFCEIEVDGVEVSKNTASGGYQIATCSGLS